MNSSQQYDPLVLQRGDVEGFSLFPMPSAAMENYMMWTAKEHFPNSFRITIVFQGILKQSPLFKSFLQAVRRHPMLCASIHISSKATMWYLPEMISFPHEHGFSFSQQPFGVDWDLTRSPGVRFWYEFQADKTELTLEFHHASTDGQGAQQFIHDWFAFYHDGDSLKGLNRVPKLECGLLQKREEYPRRTRLASSEESLSVWKKMELAYRFHFQVPEELRSYRSRRIGNSQEAFQRWVVGSEGKRQAMEGMKHYGMNLTEWTAWITAMAMKEWMIENNGRCRRLRVMVPTSHRTYEDRRLPACNRIGFAFVSLNQKSLSMPDKMVGEIKAQFSGIRRFKLGLDFLEQLHAVARYHWLAKRLFNIDRCWTTAVVSSLGDIGTRVQRLLPKSEYGTQTSDAHISQVFGFPPIRRRCHLAVGVCEHGEEIYLGFRTFLPQSHACRLTDIFRELWTESGKKV